MTEKYSNGVSGGMGATGSKAIIFAGFLLWLLSGAVFLFSLSDGVSATNPFWPASDVGKALFVILGSLQVPLMVYALIALYRQKAPAGTRDAPLPRGVLVAFQVSCILLAGFWLVIFLL